MSMVHWFFFGFFLLAIIQLIYWFQFHKLVGSLRQQPNYKEQHLPVSVIICGKNEAAQIKHAILQILKQDYQTFEVIFVDDNSTDNTFQVLSPLLEDYANFKIIPNDNVASWKGKKSALDCGIRHSSFDHILVTDADCTPGTNQWITAMANCYQNNIVLGYGPYNCDKHNLLNQWIRWETMHTFIQYSCYAQAGYGYMGVGRNMMYPKSIYEKATQQVHFLEIYNKIPSGDDDLLLQEMCKHTSVHVCVDDRSMMYSSTPTSWKEYWAQKARHTSTGKYYSPRLKFLLSIYAFSHAGFWVLAMTISAIGLISVILGLMTLSWLVLDYIYLLPLAIILFAYKLYITRKVFYQFHQLLHPANAVPNFLVRGDLFWALYNLILSPYILIKNKQRWKS